MTAAEWSGFALGVASILGTLLYVAFRIGGRFTSQDTVITSIRSEAQAAVDRDLEAHKNLEKKLDRVNDTVQEVALLLARVDERTPVRGIPIRQRTNGEEP